MSKLENWVNETPERKRAYAQECLIVSATEQICSLMDLQKMSKADLAKALGCSKAHVTALLSGSRNMTLRTLADISQALNAQIRVDMFPRSMLRTRFG